MQQEHENQVDIPPRAFEDVPLGDIANNDMPPVAQPEVPSGRLVRIRRKCAIAARTCQACMHFLMAQLYNGMTQALAAITKRTKSLLGSLLNIISSRIRILKAPIQVVGNNMSHLASLLFDYLRNHFMEVLGTTVAISFGSAMLYYAKRADDSRTGLNSMLETYCTCTTAAQPICVRFFGYKRYMGCMAIKRPSWYFSECVLKSTPKIWASLWAKDSLITIYGRLDLPAVETIIAVMTSYVFLIGGRRYRNLGWILCIFSGILLLAELGGAFNPVFSSSSKAKCIQRVIDEFGNIQGRDNPFYIEWTKKVDISSLSHEGLEHIMVRLDALMFGEGWDDLPKQLLASQRMRTASAVQSVN